MRWFPFFLIALASSLMASDQAFPPTPSGVAELKTLPAGVLLKTTVPGNYFAESSRLFFPLFKYISQQGIAMTSPVEAQIDQAAMYFWVGINEQEKIAGNRGGVEVVRTPERRVASRGARGGYSAENFNKTREALAAWLLTRPEVEVTGPAYGVYWDGPLTPSFFKRFEVHLPVRPTAR